MRIEISMTHVTRSAFRGTEDCHVPTSLAYHGHAGAVVVIANSDCTAFHSEDAITSTWSEEPQGNPVEGMPEVRSAAFVQV